MATRKPHILMVPHAAQGHVYPMLKLARKLTTEHGFAVTVVNFEFIHKKISTPAAATQQKQSPAGGMIRLISIPDGLESPLDEDNWIKMTECLEKVLPLQLRSLLQKHQSSAAAAVACGGGDGHHQQEVSWVIADAFVSGAFVVAKEMGIKTAAFWTASMANLALLLRVPQLIGSGIIDENGFLLNNIKSISLIDEIPAWRINELVWNIPGQSHEIQEFLFRRYYANISRYSKLFDCFLVNSFYELEMSACQLFPSILPVGPLLEESSSTSAHNNNNNNVSGSFWLQDSTCQSWLDKQSKGSVIYVAFGSITVLTHEQFCELALGLEMTGKPFLWVIRANFVKGSSSSPEFPEGFLERVGDRCKIVEWVNQEVVLSHPCTGCFVSHCGWNSTLEGLCAGVPFLCWPYFVDQFHNQESICEAWQVGLKLKVDSEIGLVTRSEIASKVEELLLDENIQCNSNKLMESARVSVSEDGSSFRNFMTFFHNLCS